jgi:hypothetical protein
MASEEGPGQSDRPDRVDLTPHPLVPPLEELGAEPDDGLSRLVGFIGPSEKDARIRIYLDLSFASYCEVASADVVQTAPVDVNDSNSPSIVWVKDSAQMRLVSIRRLQGDATLVTGAIRDRYYRRAARRLVPAEEDTFEDTVPPVCEPKPKPVPYTVEDDPLSCSHLKAP